MNHASGRTRFSLYNIRAGGDKSTGFFRSFGRSVVPYQRVTHVDPGFRPDHVLTCMVNLPNEIYDSPGGKKMNSFWEQLIDRLQAMPGVDAAGIISCAPLGCHWVTFYQPEGRAPLKPGEVNPVILFRPASEGYFKAMGIRLARGRFFDRRDEAVKWRVAVVNRSFARAYWPGVEDPVGKRFKVNDPKAEWITMIRMVEDIKHYGLERPIRPGIYYPMYREGYSTMTVAIRTAGDPADFTPTARAALQALDPELPMYRVRTMEESMKPNIRSESCE